MSIHSTISKTVGWEPKCVYVPSMTEAEELVQKAKEMNWTSYAVLLSTLRFAPSQETAEGQAVINYIYNEFHHTLRPLYE